MHTLLHIGVLTGTVVLASRLIPGVRVKSTPAAIGVAVVFSVLNFLVGWAIKALLIIPTILTLGLLYFFIPLIVNAALLWVTDRLLHVFEIQSVKALALLAVLVTAVNWIFFRLI
jgi:putative membrane protein